MKIITLLVLVVVGLAAGLNTACDYNIFRLVWIAGMLPLTIDLHLASNVFSLIFGVLVTAGICSKTEFVRLLAIVGTLAMGLQLIVFSGFPDSTVQHICQIAVWL